MANWYDLSGQVAIVTGGSTGLGLAVTRCLVSAGAKVCVVSFEAPEQAAEALEEFGSQAAFYQFDITDTDHAGELVDRIVKEHGRVDILVNNAGITRDGLLMRMSEEAFDSVIDTNLKGTFHCMRFAARQMMKQRSGRIINLSSIACCRKMQGRPIMRHRKPV